MDTSKPKKFTSKPHEVEAMQYQGSKNEMDLRNFCPQIQPGRTFGEALVLDLKSDDNAYQIVEVGHWVLKNEGRFWAENHTSFEKGYE